MHYLSNNQGSEFILQIIIAFVAPMAKISNSSEPLTTVVLFLANVVRRGEGPLFVFFFLHNSN